MKLLAAKQRPVELGLILIAADYNQLGPFVGDVDDRSLAQVFATWPGAVTWLLPKNPATPSWLTGHHDTIAVRVTAHPIAAMLCRYCNSPLVSTSANITGRSAACTPLQVRKQLAPAVDLIIHGDVPDCGHPSEIRDAASGRIVRPG